MTDEQRVGIQLAKSVLATLATVALAPTEGEAVQAFSLYEAACRDWDRWRLSPTSPGSWRGSWPAGDIGAVAYLQHMASIVKP